MSAPKEEFLNRLRTGTPHHRYFSESIDKCYAVVDYLNEAKAKIAADKSLSEHGRREKMNALIKDHLAGELARASRPFEVAKRSNDAARKAIGTPNFDKTDLAAAVERQEVRAYLRGLSRSARYAAATEMMGDLNLAQAILSGSSNMLSGLTALETKELKDLYLSKYFGSEVAARNEMDDDLQPVGAAFEVARRAVFEASGLTPTAFDAMMAPHLSAALGENR